MAVAVAVCSVLLAVLYIKIGEAWKLRRLRKLLVDTSLVAGDISVHSTDHTPLLLKNEEKEYKVEIPPRALLISSSIAAIKIFYFGAALSAHHYLFYMTQRATGIKYVQNKPWMRYSDAVPLIIMSIPAILLFDFVIPGLFIYLCWRFRDSAQSPQVLLYFGSLFDGYNPRVYWWELASTIQKLVIALISQAFQTSNAWQWILIVFVLSITLVMQAYLNPWRRKIENIFENIATLLLIAALISTRPTSLTHSTDVVILVVALCLLFTLASWIAIGWQTWNGRTDYQKDFERHQAENATPNTDLAFQNGFY